MYLLNSENIHVLFLSIKILHQGSPFLSTKILSREKSVNGMYTYISFLRTDFYCDLFFCLFVFLLLACMRAQLVGLA